ncbi:MAG: prepilin-type N-terminal cleavage/methylation domain-containing protein [Nitrospirae bacterium]|nr:MAG: prepilin-type N-terminal cleavage/methylation domain-containing protein [Nitrospirota bacterium]
MSILKKQSGFTLIEVIVVAGIIAVLAGILVPIIFKEIDESKKTRATADVKSISSALMVLKKDTGQWPVSANCSPGVTMLVGNGAVPALAANWDNSSVNNFSNYLATDDNGCWPNTWKGPYMPTVTADPWGNAYMINAVDFLSVANPPATVWLISAGPNGVLDTAATVSALNGDDIGIRLQ